jgi:hypothetical protein
MTARRLISVATSTAVALASVVLVFSPIPATAAALPCASSARITARTGSGHVAWAGKETNGKLITFTGTTLTRGDHFYELYSKTIVLSFGKNTYRLSGNAVFDLGCSGEAAGDRAIMPSISMLRGKATVRTTHVVEGSVLTEEDLVGPIPSSAATKYQVVRKLKQTTTLTMRQKIDWYQDLYRQPTGSTTSKTLTTTRVNVTPYVGPRHGTCRHVHSSVLTTTTTYGHGTAVYHF